MKAYVYILIIAASSFLTSCYTEIGYDYEREAYWDKVEGKKSVKKDNQQYDYEQEDALDYGDSSEYYADGDYDDSLQYEDEQGYVDDYNYSRTSRYYDYYYPGYNVAVYSRYYDPFWDYNPFYSYYYYNPFYYPFRYNYYNGWYSSGYYYDHYPHYTTNYFSKTKERTNWNSRLRDNTGGRNHNDSYSDRASRSSSSSSTGRASLSKKSDRSDITINKDRSTRNSTDRTTAEKVLQKIKVLLKAAELSQDPEEQLKIKIK